MTDFSHTKTKIKVLRTKDSIYLLFDKSVSWVCIVEDGDISGIAADILDIKEKREKAKQENET